MFMYTKLKKFKRINTFVYEARTHIKHAIDDHHSKKIPF